MSRTEFRFPLSASFEGGMFLDMGALALDPAAIGAQSKCRRNGHGHRFQTPIGPFVVDLATPLLTVAAAWGSTPQKASGFILRSAIFNRDSADL